MGSHTLHREEEVVRLDHKGVGGSIELNGVASLVIVKERERGTKESRREQERGRGREGGID